MPELAINPVLPALELRGIDKRFGRVHANRAVSLTIAAGRIVGIVGENGAGKSTLMSIVYGLYTPDAGEIRINGRPTAIRSPADAIGLGIGMVHQHFLLIDSFTVLENLLLGVEGGPLLGGGMAAARRKLQQLAEEYGLAVDADALVSDLSVGEQQRVEILKTLMRGAQILILDEPSAVLTPQETEQLFRILRKLRDGGTTILLITHKLREIMAVTDEVHVMRQGALVATRATAETDARELAELMVGRAVRLTPERTPAATAETLVQLDGVSLIDSRGVVRLQEISLDLRAGEILGIAGVSGNGQSELLQLLAGIAVPSRGRLRVGTRQIDADHPGDPAEMRLLGVAHVPEDRLRQGLISEFSASASAVLGYQERRPFSIRGWLDWPAIRSHCQAAMQRFDIRPADPELACSGFSGGNQQKLILARELGQQPRILLFGQPTRGVDIGAIEFIHQQILAARERGCAILLISVELDEILALSDRIAVINAGRIVGTLAAAEADERRIGLMMTASAA